MQNFIAFGYIHPHAHEYSIAILTLEQDQQSTENTCGVSLLLYAEPSMIQKKIFLYYNVL